MGRESSIEKAKSSYGSLFIGKCRSCGGEAVVAKGRYKTYIICSHCDKVYKVKQHEIMAGLITVAIARKR